MSDGPAMTGDTTGNVQPGDGDQPGGGGGAVLAMDDLRSATMMGLDESYHEEWNTLSQRITTPSDLAKSYVESQRYAKSAIKLPGNDAKPEEWGEIYNKLGRPQDPNEYKFTDVFGEGENVYKVTDEDKAFRDAFRPVAHRAGLTQKQVHELESFQFENNQVFADAQAARAADLTERYHKTLKEQYGPDFENNKQMYLTSTRHYSGEDWDALTSMRLEDGTYLLDHPAMFRMMSKVGAERVEDFREPNAFNQSAREDAQTEHQRIRDEAISKGLSPSHPDWPHQQLQRLADRIHGSSAVAGRQSVSNF